MKKIIFLSLLLCSFYKSNAQDCNKAVWAKSFGGNSLYNGIVDGGRRNDGTFTVCGSYGNSTFQLGTINLADSGFYHYFLANHDSSGTFTNGTIAAWYENSSDICVIRKIDVGIDNSVYITGYWRGSTVFIGDVLLPSSTRNRVFVAKFNDQLESKWVRYSDWMAADCQANDVASDQNKNVYIVGRFEDNAFKMGNFTVQNYGGNNMWRDDAFFMKFDSLGNTQFLKNIGSPNDDAAMAVVADNNGDIIIFGSAGSTTSNFKFDEHIAIQGTPANSLFLAKYSGIDGHCIWGKFASTLFASNTFSAFDACLAEDNNVLVCGQLAGQVNFYPNTYYTSDGDGYLAKIDTDGNNLWLKTIGGQNSSEIAKHVSYYNGKIAISGTLYSNQPYVGDFPLYSTLSGGGFQAFNAMFNTSGQTLWARGNNVSGSTYYNGCALIDDNGNQLLWGSFKSTQNWYPLSLTNSSSNHKLFLVKFEPFSQTTPFTVSAGPDKEISCGNFAQLNGSINPTTISYGWYPNLGFSGNGNKTPSVNFGINTMCYFYGTYMGCVYRDTVNVSYSNSEITIDAGNDLNFCHGDSIQINTNSSQASATYTWYPSTFINTSTSQNPYVKPNSTTSYIVTATYNGCIDIDTVTVYSREKPIISLPKQDLYYSYYRIHLCANDSLDMIFGNPLYDYNMISSNLVTNAHDNVATLLPISGILKVEATSIYGCYSRDSASVIVHNNQTAPQVLGSVMDRMVCPDDSVNLQVLFTNSASYTFQYGWYSGWQVDSLNGNGWNDISYWDRFQETNSYSTGYPSSTYYSTLKIRNVNANMDGFKFRPYIYDYCSPRGYGDSATLFVGPKISVQPQNITLCQGATDSINVNTASVNSAYFWEIMQGNSFVPLIDQAGVISANGRFLRIENASLSLDSSWVRCKIEGCSPISQAYTDSVLIRVVPVAQITFETQRDTVCQGDSLILMVVVDNPQFFTFRWYENDVIITSNTSSLWGYNTNTLHFTPVNASQNNKTYKCKISNASCNSNVFSNVLSFKVDTSPQITWSTGDYTACSNEGLMQIPEAFPTGGTYSGNYVQNENYFNPNGLSQGNYQIRYTFVDPVNNCPSVSSKNITVYSPPSAVWNGGNILRCENEITPFTLSGGTPSGGFYEGIGVYNGSFYPDSVNVGTYDIHYIYTQSTSGCMDSASRNIVITALPNVTWSGNNDSYCIDDAPFSLSGGLPSGGIYSGSGVTSGSLFSPSLAGIGTHEIQYEYTLSSSGCSNTANKIIEVLPLPSVTWSVSLANCCLNDSPITLNGGQPIGGAYSGTGVTQNLFNPSIAGYGSHSLLYTYSDENNCSAQASQSIFVDECTGISNNENNNLNVFSIEGQLWFTNNFYFKNNYKVDIFNVLGQQIISNKFSDNCSFCKLTDKPLEKGIYFVHFSNGTNEKMFKVLVF